MGKSQLMLLDIRADDRRPLPVDGDCDDREPFVLILSVQRLQTGALPQAKRSPSRPDVQQDRLPPETRHVHELSIKILQLKIGDWNPIEGPDLEFRHERLGVHPGKFGAGLLCRRRGIPLVGQPQDSGQKQGGENPDGEGG